MTAAPLDFEACYRACDGRDARFDGQFVTAVRSTGIYCRPSCPARTPKRANVAFYRTSAAAHLAGYRACKRCLPEAVPGSPEWRAREDVAARAMRLIADGLVDREGVPGLAATLGYSTRQLTRILDAELGAGPLALARAQRAQNARHLLVSTDMPAGDVAFAAGFASLRQFNDTVAEVFGMTPTALRGSRRSADRLEAGPGEVTVRLRARPPFDAAGVVAWLGARAVTGLEHLGDDGSYTRSVRLAGGAAVARVAPDEDGVRVSTRLESLSDLPALLSRTRRLFDLDADPREIDGALAAHPAFAAAVAEVPGIRIAGTLEPAEMVARAVLGQQVSVAAARTAVQRLADATAEPLPAALAAGAPVDRMFPTAGALAEVVEDAVGGPAARRRALADACVAIAAGDVSLGVGQTTDNLVTSLTSLRGIGPWTAQYVALRVLGSPDLLLTGDSAVRAGAARLGLPTSPRELAAATAPAAPWRSYLMMHLWRLSAPAPKGDTS